MTDFMFEIFNVPTMYKDVRVVFSLYASGCMKDIVMDLGDGVSHTMHI